MLQKLKFALQRFMMGRNGGDTLGWVVLIASAICSIAAGIEGFEWLTAVSFIGLAYTIFRMYSRNVVKRRQENAKFVETVLATKNTKNAKILLVTSAWHMRRSLLMFKKYVPKLDVIPAATVSHRQAVLFLQKPILGTALQATHTAV